MNNQKLTNFMEGMSKYISFIEKKRKEENRIKSNDFNLFYQFFRLGENKYSEIIAFFLDPNQTHGQGNLFLKEFINYNKVNVDENLLNAPNIRVNCEGNITNSRRIDIFIEFITKEKDKTVIAIENKLGAEDQEHQLFDYDDFLYKTTDNYKLIYLNKYGDAPKEDSIKKEGKDMKKKHIPLTYNKDMISIIDKWLKVNQSERIKFLLEDFKQYIKYESKNISIMKNYSKELASEIVDKKQVQTFFKLIEAEEEVKAKLMEKIIQILKENDFNNIPDKFGYEDTDATLDLENGYKLGIGFEEKFDYLYIGVFEPESEKRDKSYADELSEIMNNLNIGNNLRKGENFNNWLWVTRTNKYHRWLQPEPWVDVENGIFENYILRIINKVKSKKQ